MSAVESEIEVGQAEFNAELEAVLAAADPVEGLFGPDSIVWRVTRFTVVNLGATGIGGVVDGAHPWIAQGVADHSKLFTDPGKRFESTYSLLNRIVFGDAEQVRRVARALYGMHSRVEGTIPDQAARFEGGSAYHANEANALLWVYLVYFWLRMRLYQELIGSRPESDWDRYAVEATRFGACFGIPDDMMPKTAAQLREAFESFVTSDAIGGSEALTVVLDRLDSLLPAIGRPAFAALCIRILPESLHPIVRLDQRRFARLIQVPVLLSMRAGIRLMPSGLRFLPAYHEAQHRLGGPEVGKLTRRFNTRLMGRPTVLN